MGMSVVSPKLSTNVYKKNTIATSPELKIIQEALFIGQAPAEPGGPVLEGRSATRLCKLAGLPADKLFFLFERCNVLEEFPGRKGTGDGDFFDLQKGREGAKKINVHRYRLVIFLGLNVAKAFNVKNARLFKELRFGKTIGLILPHPSGCSHFWNTKDNRELAARKLRYIMKKAKVGKYSKYFNRIKLPSSKRVLSKYFSKFE